MSMKSNGIPTSIGHGPSVYLCSLNSFQRVKANKVQRKKSYFLHPVESDSLNKWETKSKIKNMNQPKGQHIYMNCNI